MSATRNGANTPLTAAHAQKILDYVALRLEMVEASIAERLLDEFVERLRCLEDIGVIKGRIARGDHAALKQFGGIDGAKAMIELIEKIGDD